MNRLLVDLSDCAVRKAVLDLRRPADLRYLGDTLSALKRVGHMATRLVTLVIDNSVRLSRCVRTAFFSASEMYGCGVSYATLEHLNSFCNFS